MRKTAWLGIVVVIAIALLNACTIYGGKHNSGWNATGGEALERQFWKDMKAKNVAELEKHIAVSCVFVSPDGALDRSAAMDRIRQTDMSDYVLGDFKVIPNGIDMVVTYTANVSGSPNTAWQMMTVWQKGEKSWMAVAHAAVPRPQL